jgi:hypothetical protein
MKPDDENLRENAEQRSRTQESFCNEVSDREGGLALGRSTAR